MKPLLGPLAVLAILLGLTAAAPSAAKGPQVYVDRNVLFPTPASPPGGNITTYYTPAMPTLFQPLVPGSCACNAPVRPTPSFYAAPRPQTPVAQVVEVGIYDNQFGPAAVTVTAGATVRWVNRGQHSHTVTSHAVLFDSGGLAPGATFALTFPRPGTYYFYCRFHPQEMRGTVIVG
jgi:plastocyanin